MRSTAFSSSFSEYFRAILSSSRRCDLRRSTRSPSRYVLSIAGQAREFQMFRGDVANARQRPGKFNHMIELSFIAHLPPVLMIFLLLASPRIPPHRLNVPAITRTDPHVFPGRRNRQPADALDRPVLRDTPAPRVDICKVVPMALAPDAGFLIGNITNRAYFTASRASRRTASPVTMT